jgi:cysteinyl-tRNA synthetase
LASLFELATEVNRSRDAKAAGLLKALGGVLGVLQQSPRSYLQAARDGSALNASAIDALIAQRNAAKQAKNFVEADRIRKALTEMGVELKDSAAGTTWVAAGSKP